MIPQIDWKIIDVIIFLLQIFTVPQNFTDVTFNDNIQLYGQLNGFDLPKLVADTVSVNEPALLSYVIFGNFELKFYLKNKNNDSSQMNWSKHLHWSILCSFIDNVKFKKTLNIGGTLSGIRIPDDLILSQSDSLQNFNEPITFASDVNIVGTLSIADKLNAFNLRKMCELLEPLPDVAPQKLTIKGEY